MKTPENKPTINIKITDLESGKELLNKNTNTIIGGCADNEGNCCSITSTNGARISVIYALRAKEKALEQLKHECPIEVLLYEASNKSDKETTSSNECFDPLKFNEYFEQLIMEKLKRTIKND